MEEINNNVVTSTTTFILENNNLNETDLEMMLHLDNQQDSYFYFDDNDLALSQGNNNSGETLASITNSILDQLNFADSSSIAANNIGFDDDALLNSICKSKSLFSPADMDTNQSLVFQERNNIFSTDSLDNEESDDLMRKCCPSNDLYTLAFNGNSSSEFFVSLATDKKSLIFDVANSHSNNARSISIQTSASAAAADKTRNNSVLVCYPSYTLPNLNFLQNSAPFKLAPQTFKRPMMRSSHGNAAEKKANRKKRPFSCNDVIDRSKIKDFDSLNFLLPRELQLMLQNKSSCEHGNEKPLNLREKNENEKDIFEVAAEGTEENYKSEKDIVKEMTLEITKNLEDLETLMTQFENGGKKRREENFENHFKISPGFQNNKQKKHSENEKKQNCFFKRLLTETVGASCENVLAAASGASSTVMSASPCGQLVLGELCPAIYSLLSDGLAPSIDTIFGKVGNSVWKMVEQSIQNGPTAQPLSELVLKINSEDLLTEGPIRFNAFVVGLLNIHNLGSWLTFLRTKERLLRIHYCNGDSMETNGLLFYANTVARGNYDAMLNHVHALSRVNFRLDIFHQVRKMHRDALCCLNFKTEEDHVPVIKARAARGASAARVNVSKRSSPAAEINKSGKLFANNAIFRKEKELKTFNRKQVARSNSTENNKNKNNFIPKSKSQATDLNNFRPKSIENLKNLRLDNQLQKSISADNSPMATNARNTPEFEKFKKLQLFWESGNYGNPKAEKKSKIPRPISNTSPIKHSKKF